MDKMGEIMMMRMMRKMVIRMTMTRMITEMEEG